MAIPYDGHTLKGCHQSDGKDCWFSTEKIYVDLGYEGRIIIRKMFKFIFPIKTERK
ncbi:hypothetical protein LEP1GSC026_4722 [Leptospira interrogans str. 2002000623]|nr:hypothetical protein LEP1GSC026_4722 [Leptospira interrogans str. 2002000623]